MIIHPTFEPFAHGSLFLCQPGSLSQTIIYSEETYHRICPLQERDKEWIHFVRMLLRGLILCFIYFI